MMLLTATTETQGRRSSDSCTAIDGELVTLAETNDCDQFEPTSPYPRSFRGLSSGELTTTAVARDLPLTDADLRIAVRGHLEVFHPSLLAELADRDDELEDVITGWAGELEEIGRALPAGPVVERWWDEVIVRGPGPLAPERPRPLHRRAFW